MIEYFANKLDSICIRPGTGLSQIFDHGFEVQTSTVAVPKSFQLQLRRVGGVRQVWASVGRSRRNELGSLEEQSCPVEH